MARKIVLAFDGSENATYAVEWSLDNFLRQGDHVCILFVYPEFIELQQDADGLCVALDKISEKTAQSLIKANDLLSNAKDKISARGLDVELIVESGDARGFIPLVCEKVNADALIMGSRGLGGIKSWLLGSVSDHCARNVKCPLVIVRPRDA